MNVALEEQDVLEMMGCLKDAGITDIMISKEIYKLFVHGLPPGFKLYLELEEKDSCGSYRGITKFFKRYCTEEKDVVCSYQLNDIREVIKLRTYNMEHGVLLSGMDDFICHDFLNTFQEIRNSVNSDYIILRPENKYECATAIAVEFLKNKGEYVIASFLGTGNIAATEQVLLALRTSGQFKMKQNFSSLLRMKVLYEKLTDDIIGGKVPVIGDAIFEIESGIHVDGILKNASNYECIPAKMLGRTRKISLGKHSGRASIEYKGKELGVPKFSDRQAERILAKVKMASVEKRRGVSDEEFLNIVKKELT